MTDRPHQDGAKISRTCGKCGKPYTSKNKFFCSRICAGNTSHGLTRTLEYRSWQNMLDRTRNPNYPDYPRYGGRGITMCERWQKFENFISDMGMRPDPSYTLDRIDVDGNYEPSNCRWADRFTQARNRRICWTPDEDRQLRECIERGLTHKQTAEELGFTEGSVVSRASRIGLTEKPKRLTSEQVQDIRSLAEIASVSKLAQKYGVCRETIYRIWDRRTYREVQR